MTNKLIQLQSASSNHFTLVGDSRKNLQKAVAQSLLASFEANKCRAFVIVCSYSEQKKLTELIRESGLVVKETRSNGSIWLQGATDYNGMPTVIFRQCRTGNEEALAGFFFRHSRWFINGDYATNKMLVVASASVGYDDNAMTIYKDLPPVAGRVYLTDFQISEIEGARVE